MGKDRVEWKPRLVCNQNFAQGRRQKPKVKKFSEHVKIRRPGEQTTV